MRKIVVLCCLALLALSAFFLNAAAEPIAIIVNKANEIDSLNSSELARIYKGRLEKWQDGRKIVVINRPFDSEIRFQFYNIVLESKPTKKFFKLGSPIPIKTMVLKSGLATRKFTARIPNAIGYAYLSEADDTVKVLKIDGSLPGEQGYKLK